MDSSSHYIVTDSPKMTHQQGQLIMPSSFEQRSLGKKKGEKFQNTSGTWLLTIEPLSYNIPVYVLTGQASP